MFLGHPIDKMYVIAKIHVSVYRTSLQLQIDDYINSTSIQQFFPPIISIMITKHLN